MVASSLLLLLPLLAVAGCATALPRPNILFLQCDEMDGRILDPRHPLSHVTAMPALRKLASRGINFVASYAENPLCAPSRASTFTGRRTSSIRTWNNVKALTTVIGQPSVSDPACAKIVGYGPTWCVAEGRRQNVTTSIRHSLVALGYDVRLYGKMDTGGEVCRPEIDVCNAKGYHDPGNWTVGPNARDVTTYYHGDLIHSWAGAAGISRPVFKPLDSPNKWINLSNPDGGPFATDWPTIDLCTTFLKGLPTHPAPGAKPFALYCSILDPHPPVSLLLLATIVRNICLWLRASVRVCCGAGSQPGSAALVDCTRSISPTPPTSRPLTTTRSTALSTPPSGSPGSSSILQIASKLKRRACRLSTTGRWRGSSPSAGMGRPLRRIK